MRRFLSSIYPPILLILISFFLNSYSGNVLIPLIAPERTVMEDISFRFLPYWSEAYLVSNILLLIQLLLFFYVSYINGFKDIRSYLWIVGVVFTLRAITILFNPVAPSWSEYENRYLSNPGLLGSDINGFFFSGHTSFTVLLSIFTLKISREVGVASTILTLVIVFLIIVGRSHYLIDIYGAIVTSILVSYIVGVIRKSKV